MVHLARGAALAAALGLGAACQASGPPPLVDPTAAATRPGLRWPRPPAETRVAWLGQIRGEEGFVAPAALWRRLLGRFLGSEREQLVRPAALSVRGSALAIADPGQPAVHLLDLVARRWTTLRNGPDGAPLASPVAVLLLPDGRLLVTDSAAEAIWSFGADGQPLGRFTEAPLRRPTGLALAADGGGVWVAETAAHRLRGFDLEGRERAAVGRRGSGLGEFNFPIRIAPGRGGLWVTDSLNFRIQLVDPSGQVGTSFGVQGRRSGAFARPRGLAVDGAGRVFVVDALFDAIQIFEPTGQLLLSFGSRGSGPGKFWLPSDVALAGGRVYVADSYNRRVQIFAYTPPDER